MKTINNFTSFDYAEKVAKNYDAVISIGYKLDDKFFNPECKRLYLEFEDIEFEELDKNPGAIFDKIPKEDHVRTLIKFVKELHPVDKLLIHCVAGFSRSPAATVIALCERDKISFHEALKKVKECRIPDQGSVSPNNIMINHYLNIKNE